MVQEERLARLWYPLYILSMSHQAPSCHGLCSWETHAMRRGQEDEDEDNVSIKPVPGLSGMSLSR